MTQRTLAYANQQARDGERIRARRTELLLTQREAAALVGVTAAAIGLVERGFGSAKLRRRVSDAMEAYRAEAVSEWIARAPMHPERAPVPAFDRSRSSPNNETGPLTEPRR